MIEFVWDVIADRALKRASKLDGAKGEGGVGEGGVGLCVSIWC